MSKLSPEEFKKLKAKVKDAAITVNKSQGRLEQLSDNAVSLYGTSDISELKDKIGMLKESIKKKVERSQMIQEKITKLVPNEVLESCKE